MATRRLQTGLLLLGFGAFNAVSPMFGRGVAVILQAAGWRYGLDLNVR